MRVYVNSTRGHPMHGQIVADLRRIGHLVYDPHSAQSRRGRFHWTDVDPDWQDWTKLEFAKALQHPKVVEGVKREAEAIAKADCCLLLTPANNEAHLISGYFLGLGKPLYIYLGSDAEEASYHAAGAILISPQEVLEFFARMALPTAELVEVLPGEEVELTTVIPLGEGPKRA